MKKLFIVPLLSLALAGCYDIRDKAEHRETETRTAQIDAATAEYEGIIDDFITLSALKKHELEERTKSFPDDLIESQLTSQYMIMHYNTINDSYEPCVRGDFDSCINLNEAIDSLNMIYDDALLEYKRRN